MRRERGRGRVGWGRWEKQTGEGKGRREGGPARGAGVGGAAVRVMTRQGGKKKLNAETEAGVGRVGVDDTN